MTSVDLSVFSLSREHSVVVRCTHILHLCQLISQVIIFLFDLSYYILKFQVFALQISHVLSQYLYLSDPSCSSVGFLFQFLQLFS